MNAQSNKPPIQELEDATNVITNAIDDLRSMSRMMSADMILHNGFKNALEEEIIKINKLGSYNAEIQITGEAIFMEGKKELMLFRIVQEALQNIIKHAAANKILIELFYEHNSLFLNISDNGKGFDANNIDTKGQGIMNMKKRTAILHGKFEIQSTLQNGTANKIKIPTND